MMNKEELHRFISGSTGNESNICQILAGIIERATGEKCIDFANKNLFEPLGLPERIPHVDASY